RPGTALDPRRGHGPGERRPRRVLPDGPGTRGARPARRGPVEPRDRLVALRLAAHGEAPPGPHLRQARREEPQRGARAGRRPRAPRLAQPPPAPLPRRRFSRWSAGETFKVAAPGRLKGCAG